MGLRYYLLREGTFGEDIPVSLERFKQIYNSELANNFGNLVSRVVAIIQKIWIVEFIKDPISTQPII